jgi:hypothetical protein
MLRQEIENESNKAIIHLHEGSMGVSGVKIIKLSYAISVLNNLTKTLCTIEEENKK